MNCKKKVETFFCHECPVQMPYVALYSNGQGCSKPPFPRPHRKPLHEGSMGQLLIPMNAMKSLASAFSLWRFYVTGFNGFLINLASLTQLDFIQRGREYASQFCLCILHILTFIFIFFFTVQRTFLVILSLSFLCFVA
jgi:hypothetical protein